MLKPAIARTINEYWSPGLRFWSSDDKLKGYWAQVPCDPQCLGTVTGRYILRLAIEIWAGLELDSLKICGSCTLWCPSDGFRQHRHSRLSESCSLSSLSHSCLLKGVTHPLTVCFHRNFKAETFGYQCFKERWSSPRLVDERGNNVICLSRTADESWH